MFSLDNLHSQFFNSALYYMFTCCKFTNYLIILNYLGRRTVKKLVNYPSQGVFESVNYPKILNILKTRIFNLPRIKYSIWAYSKFKISHTPNILSEWIKVNSLKYYFYLKIYNKKIKLIYYIVSTFLGNMALWKNEKHLWNNEVMAIFPMIFVRFKTSSSSHQNNWSL